MQTLYYLTEDNGRIRVVRKGERVLEFLSALRWKASLVRYRVLRQAASLRLVLRPVHDCVYMWPPFGPEDQRDLQNIESESLHYLHSLEMRVCYFLRNEQGLTRNIFSMKEGRVISDCRTNENIVRAELRQARYCALWKCKHRPRAGSLRPHIYVVVNTEWGTLGSRDWLRLVSDIYLSQHSIPARAHESLRSLESCAILGTGPSVDRFIAECERWDGWIGANFLVCDERIVGIGRPVAYCIADPGCFAPTAQFRHLRERLFQFLRNTPAVFVTLMDYAPFIELNFPEEIKAKCYYTKCLGLDTYRLTTRFRADRLTVTGYGNVLTDLMLPLAACVSRKIVLYGCDGVPPGAHRYAQSPQLGKYTEAFIADNPEGFDDNSKWVDKFGRSTGYVVEECIKQGVEIVLRCPSWNAGLRGLPVMEEEAAAGL